MNKTLANLIKPAFIAGCLLGTMVLGGCGKKPKTAPAVTPIVGTLQLFFEPGTGIRTTDNAATIISEFTTGGVPTVQSTTYLAYPANPRQINIYNSIRKGLTIYNGGTFADQGTGWPEAFVYQQYIESSFLGSHCLSGTPLSPTNVSRLCCAAAVHECGHAFGFTDNTNPSNIMNKSLEGTFLVLRAPPGGKLPTFSAAQVTEMNRKLGLPYP
jgi:hypothetical protein